MLGHPFNELHVVLIAVSHRCTAKADGSLQLLSCSSDVVAFRAAIASGTPWTPTAQHHLGGPATFPQPPPNHANFKPHSLCNAHTWPSAGHHPTPRSQRTSRLSTFPATSSITSTPQHTVPDNPCSLPGIHHHVQLHRLATHQTEQWEAMLIHSQFEETYITNHHLTGQAHYRCTEVEDVHGKIVLGVVVDGHPYMNSSLSAAGTLALH